MLKKPRLGLFLWYNFIWFWGLTFGRLARLWTFENEYFRLNTNFASTKPTLK